MIRFEVKNKYSNSTQFTAEIDCDENMNINFKLGLAIKWAFKFKANLKGANLKGADLKWANLEYAIYYKSDPNIDGPINFYASNDEAMADIKRMAGIK